MVQQKNPALDVEFLSDPARAQAERVKSDATRYVSQLTAYIARSWHRPEAQERTIRAARDTAVNEMNGNLRRLYAALAPRQINEQSVQGHYSSTVDYTPAEWNEAAADWVRNAQSTRIPFLNAGRLEDRKKYLDRCVPLIKAFQPTQAKLDTQMNLQLREVTATALSQWTTRLTESVEDWPNVTVHGVDDVAGMPTWVNLDASPSSPTVYVGEVGLQKVALNLRATCADDAQTQFDTPFAVGMNEGGYYRYPAILDLDRVGGFSTNSAAVIESAVLQLLDTVPAGSGSLPSSRSP